MKKVITHKDGTPVTYAEVAARFEKSNELDLGTSLDQVTNWIEDQESVPWCKQCGDRPAVQPYDELLCDQCNSQVWRLFLTGSEDEQ